MTMSFLYFRRIVQKLFCAKNEDITDFFSLLSYVLYAICSDVHILLYFEFQFEI